MKTIDQWAARLEELIHEEAWEKPPTGELPANRAARRFAKELVEEAFNEVLRPALVKAVAEALELQKGDRPH